MIQKTILGIVSTASITLIATFYTLWQVSNNENEALKKQILQLESAFVIDPSKLKPIIEYRDKKIHVIKQVPIIVDKEDCKRELESVKNLINSF